MTLDAALDAVVGVKSRYIIKRREALDAMELWAAQGEVIEVSRCSSDANRYGEAITALNEAMNAIEDALGDEEKEQGDEG